MARKRILIIVKTYPTLSKKYGELVCTAGLDEDGNWIRIYPVPFRDLNDYQKFEKYRFVDLDLKRNHADSRPESHSVNSLTISPSDHKINTQNGWEERRRQVLEKTVIHEDLGGLIRAANVENSLSLATFRPAKILEFTAESTSREWNAAKLAAIRSNEAQGDLFREAVPRSVDKLARKIPYKFRYRFTDIHGRESHLLIEDWEIGALFWNCLKSSATEAEAVQKVRQKYMDEFTKTDLHLFLGTTREWHGRGKNPFVIIGVFHPPKRSSQQKHLF